MNKKENENLLSPRTIQVTLGTKEMLKSRRTPARPTMESVILKLVEDAEINKEIIALKERIEQLEQK